MVVNAARYAAVVLVFGIGMSIVIAAATVGWWQPARYTLSGPNPQTVVRPVAQWGVEISTRLLCTIHRPCASSTAKELPCAS